MLPSYIREKQGKNYVHQLFCCDEEKLGHLRKFTQQLIVRLRRIR